MKKLFAVIALSASATAWAADAPPKYQASCFACHSTGAAMAPKTGDAEAWAPRLEKGMDTLVASVKNGLGAMPPTGLCADCSDAEIEELINFMAAPAK
ncbi:MAG: c-type cytochrome [Halioglobus sp.]|nr:c-type cytochrome [Halioglobus sp.]